jgi:DNA-binding response OmpR family regulator
MTPEAINRKRHRGMPRVLVVDDEESIRSMLQLVLQKEGFTVTTAGTVAEALALISQLHFDVLISDLNIGHPADGFVVVSAMRRTQPETLTFLLTGYPDFETALEALRQHVNDYLIKGTPTKELVERIKTRLANGQPVKRPANSIRVPDAIEANKDWVIDQWLQRVKMQAELMRVSLSDADRKDHVPALLDAAVAHARDLATKEGFLKAAERHGTLRYQQGYSVPMIILEARLLQDVIAECIRNNFLVMDLSNLISDMNKMSDTISTELQESTRAFMNQYESHSVRYDRKSG